MKALSLYQNMGESFLLDTHQDERSRSSLVVENDIKYWLQSQVVRTTLTRLSQISLINS